MTKWHIITGALLAALNICLAMFNTLCAITAPTVGKLLIFGSIALIGYVSSAVMIYTLWEAHKKLKRLRTPQPTGIIEI